MIQELVRTALKGLRAKSNKPFYEETNFKPYNTSDAKYIHTDAKPKPVLRQVIKKHISIPADKAHVFALQPHILEDISSQTGVYCCIDRGNSGLPSESAEAVFVLRGHPRQVDIASDLIMKKVRNPPAHAHPPKNNKPFYRAQEQSGDFEPKNNEWGQGDPSAPWAMQNRASSSSQDRSKSMHSFSHSQWLEYFQPERQQAQADAWEKKVKAEQGSSLAKPLSSPANENADVLTSPEQCSEDQAQQPLLSKLQPLTEQWSQEEEAQDCPEGSETLPESESNNNEGSEELVPPEIQYAHAHAHAPSAEANVFNPAIPFQSLPQFGPSTRVVTLYYDINSNSVVVLNQYNYA
jgi:hypothetical protein